jgi:glycosyltransferase involved in cell wall biosynthesis
LIIDGETGLLVPAEDVKALSVAIERLIVDPALRNRLGEAGAMRVRKRFGMSAGINELARRFGLAA